MIPSVNTFSKASPNTPKGTKKITGEDRGGNCICVGRRWAVRSLSYLVESGTPVKSFPPANQNAAIWRIDVRYPNIPIGGVKVSDGFSEAALAPKPLKLIGGEARRTWCPQCRQKLPSGQLLKRQLQKLPFQKLPFQKLPFQKLPFLPPSDPP